MKGLSALVLAGRPEQPLAPVGKRRGDPQGPILVACPTHTGPTLTPVFVAKNCWEEKEDFRRHEVSPGQVSGGGRWQWLAGQ